MTRIVPHALEYGWPHADARIVTADGTLTRIWYRLFAQLWAAAGGSIPTSAQVYLAKAGNAVQAFTPGATPTPLGTLVLAGQPAPPGEAQVLGASPWTFVAPGGGVLVVAGGAVEVGRGDLWYPVGLVGAALPLAFGDRARVTWFGSAAPPTTWLPSY
jgi:hypothetical protein